jgi:hypothetical protein
VLLVLVPVARVLPPQLAALVPPLRALSVPLVPLPHALVLVPVQIELYPEPLLLVVLPVAYISLRLLPLLSLDASVLLPLLFLHTNYPRECITLTQYTERCAPFFCAFWSLLTLLTSRISTASTCARTTTASTSRCLRTSDCCPTLGRCSNSTSR